MAGEVQVGDRFGGYRIEALLRRGGMSIVYLAEDVNLGRKVTIKILAPELANDASFRDRFMNESRIAATLEHPNIVPIYEAEEVGGHLFIAMRYVRGTDLDLLLREEGPLEPARAEAIVRQVASALDAAHREGLVHRDVKPANILMAPGSGPETDHAYLTDFGITKRPAHGAITTRTGEIMGTVDYVAPEQVEGKPVDFRTDVYSLGCVAYQCLTGLLPYPRDSDLAVLWAHVHERPPKATDHRAELSPGVDSVLARAMAKEPKDRYDSCGAFARALEDRLGAAPPAARPKPSGRPMRHPSPRVLGIASVAAVVALGAVLAGIMLTRGSGAPGCPHFRGTRKRLERIDPKLVAAVQFASAPSRAEKIAVDQKGLVWVATPNGVDAVCSGRGQTGGAVPLSFAPKDLAVGDNGVWVVGAPRAPSASSGADGRIVRVIDAEGTTGQFRTLQDVPSHVALGIAGGGAVWILSSRGTLTRLARPSVGSSVRLPHQQTRSVNVGAGASGVVVGDTAVWVANHGAGTITRIDPDTMEKVGKPASLPGGGGDAVTSTAGTVWSLDTAHRTVVPVDADSGRPSGAPVRVGRLPIDVVSADGYVWVANGWSVWRIDPETREVRRAPVDGRVLALGAQPPVLLSRKQAIWVLVRQRT